MTNPFENPLTAAPAEENQENSAEAIKLIAEVTSFDELFNTLKKRGEGKIKDKSAEEWANRIIDALGKYRDKGDTLGLNSITNTEGLRDKVYELLGSQQS